MTWQEVCCADHSSILPLPDHRFTLSLLMNPLNSFVAKEGRRRKRIGAFQIRCVIREMEGGNPLPPQRPGEDLRFTIQPAVQPYTTVVR